MTKTKQTKEIPWDLLLGGCGVCLEKELEMLYSVRSEKDIQRVCKDLETAITQRQFGVLGVHDLKATMAKKGVDFEQACYVYEVCNPHQAKSVLSQNMDISTALPCRISVYEDQGRVTLATLKPSVLLPMFETSGLEDVAESVEKVIVESMDEAAG